MKEVRERRSRLRRRRVERRGRRGGRWSGLDGMLRRCRAGCGREGGRRGRGRRRFSLSDLGWCGCERSGEGSRFRKE